MTIGIAPVIVLDHVWKRFDVSPPVDALCDVNLTVQSGEWVAVVGASGSGKTTLLNIIGCLDALTRGSFRFGGIDVQLLTDSQRAGLRAREIGFVFQSFHLLSHRDITENVMIADLYRRTPRSDRLGRATSALQRVGLGHRSDFLPTRLSGGERQRVAIARALAGRPQLLLCDEPTGNLDSASTSNVMDLFESLHQAGSTILMITHDADVAARAQRQYGMKDGQLKAISP